MTVMNASDARANLYRLIDEANESHEPVIMRESILEGMKEPLAESVKDIGR
jgi:hypothetical protein